MKSCLALSQAFTFVHNLLKGVTAHQEDSRMQEWLVEESGCSTHLEVTPRVGRR